MVELLQRHLVVDHRHHPLHHRGRVLVHQLHLLGLDRVVVHQVEAQPRAEVAKSA